MWKDYFFFSRSQRIGIVVLTLLILFVLLANYLLPRFTSPPESETTGFILEAQQFRSELKSLDSLRQLEWENKYRSNQNNYTRYENTTNDKKNYTLSPFDPNSADSATFVKLGIKPHIASNILKYRAKGGRFRYPDDFSKVYGISHQKFDELKPYILIKQDVSNSITPATAMESHNIAPPAPMVVELNAADTTALMAIKGIGRTYARRIISYGKQLGGYHSTNQLKEVFGMTEENFERIKPFLTADVELIQPLKVNKASVDRLKAHPYLNFYQAKAIYEMRCNKSKLKSIIELKGISELTSDDMNRLEPYLSFE